MHYVLEHKPAVKFGVILSTDEEQGKSTHAFMARYPELNVGVVLDKMTWAAISALLSTNAKPGVCPADGGRRSGARVDAVDGRQRDADADDCRAQAVLSVFLTLTAASLQIPGLIPCMRRISGGDVSNIISGRAEALLISG